MGPEAYLTIELEPNEVHVETLKTVVLPWTGNPVTIRVPAGTADGSVLRLAGLGPPAADGSPQDAYVQVRIPAAPAQFGPPPQFGSPAPAPPQFGPPAPGQPQFGPPSPPGAPGQPQFGPPVPLGAPGQPQYGVPLPPPTPAKRRNTVLIGVAAAVVGLLACCGLPLAFFLNGDDEDGTPVAGVSGQGSPTPSVAATPSAVPVDPERYQALLASTDQALAEGFRTLAGAKNPKAVRNSASSLAALAGNQSRALDAVIPPPGLTAAHTSLSAALENLGAALAQTGANAAAGRICLGPAAVAQVSRQPAADQVRSAAQALAAADATRAYQVGSFVPKKTQDANRRPNNGTYVKRTQGGLGQLKIENGGTDSVVSVARGKTSVIQVYVRSKNSFTVRGVRDGTYQVFMTSGRDWDSKLKAFSRDCGHQKFDDSFKFTTTSRTYTGWTISLTPKIGGNASTSDVDPDDFPSD